MDKGLVKKSVESRARLSFSRSSGAGGQNVNKVSTKVRASVQIEDVEGLSAAEMEKAREILAPSMNGAGEVSSEAQDERLQEMNRKIAVERLASKIMEAARIPKKRFKTRPTRASRERRLKLKKLRAEIKKGRGKL